MRQTSFSYPGGTCKHFLSRAYHVMAIVFSLLLCSSIQGISQPTWKSNYPTVASGASSADITVQLSEKGTVYYVVYTTAPSSVTPSKIKADAVGTGGGTIVRNGAISVANASTSVATYLTGMPDNTTYYFYMVAEGASGLQTAVKSFTKVFPKRQTSNSFRSKFGPNALVGYLAYVPEAYYKNPTKDFPVLLLLHGMSEKVWNPQDISHLNELLRYGPAKFVSEGQEFPFIVITPQCPFSSWDDVTTDNFQTTVTKPGAFVNEIFDMIESNYRIDKSRIYLTGISMGGAGTWSYLSLPNTRVAAAIPIAGWSDTKNACVTASQNIAIWTFQGENDGAAAIQDLVKTINACKPAPAEAAKATVYPGMGHNVWNITYDNSGAGIAPDNIYDWLMRHTKGTASAPTANKAPVANAGADQVVTMPILTATLQGSGTDSDGTIASYQWIQKKGATTVLTGTNTSKLSVTGLLEGTYEYTLTVTDNAGAKAIDSVFITVKAAVSVTSKTPSTSHGTGLYAEYFTNKTLSGSPLLTEIDTTVNFNWGSKAPKSNMAIDLFSIRWSGEVVPEHSETYTFYTMSDDGINVWVNGQLLINHWASHAAMEKSGKITLEAGTHYAIKIEYYELWMAAEATLSWSSPSQAKQIVPKKNLYPVAPSLRLDDETGTGATGLSAYPMPMKDVANVRFSSNSAGNAEIKLLDDLSQVRFQTTVPVSAGTNTVPLDVSQMHSGLYVMVVNSPDKTETTKVVITK